MNNALPKNNLIATEKAIEAAAAAISLVKRVPAPLKSIADQVVRSASSVPANLAEGHGRSGRDRIAPLAHRVRLSERSRHPPSAPFRSCCHSIAEHADRRSPSLRRSPSHDLEVAQPKTVSRCPGTLPGERKTAPHGVPGPHCAGTTSRRCIPLRTNVGPGSPGERDAVCCSGYEAGRRRAIGVVAALQSTHERPRRWCDAGPL